MELYKHQKDCINNINEHFKNENKGLIKMFCGSGKSLIIYNCLLKYGINLSIVVVPSINLVTQFNDNYLLNLDKQKYNNKFYKKDYDILTICSKNESKDSNNLNYTTNKNNILDFLEKDILKIILVTYQSLKILIDIVIEYKINIDIICFDEAHHILADETKKILFKETKNNIHLNFIDSINKTLFFTATPKNSNDIMMYNPNNFISINDIKYEMLDDNSIYYEEPICGKLIYEYSHIEGVNENQLNDFKIRVDLYTSNININIFEAISRSILETGNNKVLTFHSRSETKSKTNSDVLTFICNLNKKEFLESFNKILKEFPELKNKYSKINLKG